MVTENADLIELRARTSTGLSRISGKHDGFFRAKSASMQTNLEEEEIQGKLVEYKCSFTAAINWIFTSPFSC